MRPARKGATPFEATVTEAVAAERRRRDLEDDISKRKMSASAFVPMADRIAGMSAEEGLQEAPIPAPPAP